MKNLLKLLILLNLLLLTNNSNAQTEPNKLKFRSIDLGLGIFVFEPYFYGGGGLSLYADTSFSTPKSLYSLSIIAGEDLAILGKSNYSFKEIQLMYGKEYKPKKWIGFEGFVGIGIYDQQSTSNQFEAGNTISLPIKANLKLYPIKYFALGFNTNYSINSVNNNLSLHLLTSFNF